MVLFCAFSSLVDNIDEGHEQRDKEQSVELHQAGFHSEIQEGEDKSANEGDGENIEAATKFITDPCSHCSSPKILAKL